MANYTLSVPQALIHQIRSNDQDTLVASVGLQVRNAEGALHMDWPPQTVQLGSHTAGDQLEVSLTYLQVDVPDPTPDLPDGGAIYWSFILVNAGTPNDAALIQALATACDGVAGAFLGTGPVGIVIGSAILAVDALARMLSTGCDGAVAAQNWAVTSAQLATMANDAGQNWNDWQNYPGSSSSILCGAPSNYDVNYIIVQNAPASTPGTTQVAYTTADGKMWHALRSPEGAWDGSEVSAQFPVPPGVKAVAAACGWPGEAQFMFITADGHVWQSVRRSDATSTWTGLGDWNAAVGGFGYPAAAITTASCGFPGEIEFLLIPDQGMPIFHWRCLPDGSWEDGDIVGWFDIPGTVLALAATRDGLPGKTQLVFTTPGGGVWHTIRDSRLSDHWPPVPMPGTWAGLGSLTATLGIPRDDRDPQNGAFDVTAVAATGDGVPGQAQFLFAANPDDPQQGGPFLWHTIRLPDGSWATVENLTYQLGIPGPVIASAATSNGLAGQAEFLFVTSDGTLWHTIRQPNATWTELDNVSIKLAIPGPVTAVAATCDCATPGPTIG